METQIKGMMIGKSGHRIVGLFGYTSKGALGLEVIGGTSKFGKYIKEKFAFISKNRGLKIPARRYVLCIELDESQLKGPHSDLEGLSWLELPLLLLFWNLSGTLLIHDLCQCLAAGKVSVDGHVHLPFLPDSILDSVGRAHFNFYHVPLRLISSADFAQEKLCRQQEMKLEYLYYLPIEGLFEGITKIKFHQEKEIGQGSTVGLEAA